MQIELTDNAVSSVLEENIALANSSFDFALLRVTDGIIEGDIPANWQDFKNRMCMYAGEGGDNKNIAFRETADIAKLYRFNDDITVGDGALADDDWANIFEKTMQFAMSKKMSGEAVRSSKIVAASTIMRNTIIKKVGFPSDYPTMNDFLRNFMVVYSANERLINLANTHFLTDMSIARSTKNIVTPISDDSVGGIITPLINIYGDFSIGQFFGSSIRFGANDREKHMWTRDQSIYILEAYKDVSIRQMAKSNRIVRNQKEAQNAKSKKIGSNNIESALLISIADSKTSAASEFNRRIYKDSDCMSYKMLNVIKSINRQLRNKDKIQEWDLFIQDMTDMLYLTGRNMFEFFGMDNPQGFMHSKFGKRLLECDTVEEIGSVRIAMVVEYRMARIRYNEEIRSFKEKNNANRSKIATIDNKIAAEYEVLASSSVFWSGIVREIEGPRAGEAFADLSKFDNRTKLNINLNAKDYWKNPKHSNVMEVLLDTNITKSEKELIVSDIVRWQMDYPELNAWEMGYQLELDPSPVNTDIPMLSKSIFDSVNDFEQRYNGYGKKSYVACTSNIIDAYNEYGQKNGSLTTTLRMLADDPNLLVNIDDDMYADAIISGIDKQYAQSEKSGQNPRANALYNSLAIQRMGGLFTDVDRADNETIGFRCIDDVSIVDLVSILAYPNRSILIYDKTGSNPIPINREVLCGGNSEEHIWKFLIDHPRLAMSIRMHTMRARSTTDGKVDPSALFDTSSTIAYCLKMKQNEISANKIKSLLRDHPGFGAIIAAVTPLEGKQPRSIRYSYKRIEMKLVKDLASLALEIRNNGYPNISMFVDDHLGLNIDSIRKTGYEGDPYELRNQVIKYIEKYVHELADSDIVLNDVYKDEKDLPKYGLDKSSISAFFDVKQELNGAKTETSTSIEGTESFNNSVWMSLLSPIDRYDIVGSYTEESIIDQLEGCMTQFGPLTRDMLDRNDEIIVEVPEGFVVQDKTTDSYGRQISSVTCFLMIKRDNGAETFNLKIKKYGDDGSDSITKSIRDDDPVGRNKELMTKLEDAFAEGGMFGAKLKLAEILKKRNEDIGYKDMDLANYMCIADLMLIDVNNEAVSTDTESYTPDLRLRSLKQIAYSIKHNLSWDTVMDGNVDDLRKEAARIAATVGTTDQVTDPARLFDNIHVSGMAQFSPVFNQSSSSFNRNFSMLKKIMLESKASQLSENAIRENKKMLYENKSVRNVIDHTKTSFKNTGYNMLGVMGLNDADVIRNPGPTTIWVVPDNSFEINEEKLNRQLSDAYDLGVTVYFPDMERIPNRFRKEAISSPFGDDGWIIPFFDIRLNGANNSGQGKFSIFEAPDDVVVISYEDTINEHSLGDSDLQLFSAFVDRINLNMTGNESILIKDMFPNVFAKYSDTDISDDVSVRFSFADNPTIMSTFINDSQYPVYIDYGVAETSDDYKKRKEHVDSLIDRYRKAYAKSDRTGWIDNAEAGDIVGWIQCEISHKYGPPQYVYAPIIPFDLKSGFDAPTQYVIDKSKSGMGFYIDGLGLEPDSTAVNVNYAYNGGLENQWFKVHEGAGAANKGMASTGMTKESLNLMNGMPIDYCYAKESTESRRGGTNKRIKTMVSMMHIVRKMGYNFADSEGCFPDRPDIADDLRSKRILIEEWNEILSDDNFRFHEDPTINSWVKNNVAKFVNNGGNPSDFLACRFGDEKTMVKWEYECLFESGYNYLDGMLKFFHSMNEELCPDGLYLYDVENSDQYLFYPTQRDGYDFGCLQMLVPHRSANPDTPDKIFYLRENVYAGYTFLSDFSGYHKPNINGASMYMDALVTMALANYAPSSFQFRKQLMWARSDMGELVDTIGFMEADYTKRDTQEVNEPLSGRIIIAGSRGFDDYESMKRILDESIDKNNSTIVSGTANGADKLGEKYASENDIDVSRYPAQWRRSDGSVDRGAGYRRNELMADNADALIAFWDGKSRGTKHMIEFARKKGLKVKVINTSK